MLNTIDLLDAAKQRAGITSEYRLCRTVGASDQTLRNWRLGRSVPDEKHAAALAELAGLDVGYVLASMAAERAKDDTLRAAWANLARRLEGLAASVLAVLVLGVGFFASPDAGAMGLDPSPTVSQAQNRATVARSVYYVNRLKHTLIGRCLAAFSRILRPCPCPSLAA